VLNEELLAQIKAFFDRRGLTFGENNRRQAFIPEGAIPIENPVGTAPGFIVESDGRYVITLPGVPREMRYLTETRVLPFLRDRLGLAAVIKSRILHTVNVPESRVDRLIADLEQEANPTVGLAAHPGQVDVRITARAPTEAEADALLAEMEARVRERLGKTIYGADEDTLEGVVGELLRERGLTLSVLETNSGGGIAWRLTRNGAGQQALREGWVATNAETLARRLGWPQVPERWLAAEVAKEIASRLREVTGADLGLVVLGEMDPELTLYSERRGQTWLALATPAGITQRELPLGGTSKLARTWITNAALDMVRRELLEQGPAG
jgi:nicotinamide-nucleotide amidase